MSTPPKSAVDPDELAAAHARYAAVRDAKIPDDHAGPRPSGGVGGTRTGVKCLHAHWAWHLAGGDDPVGRWIADRTATSAPRRATVERRRRHHRRHAAERQPRPASRWGSRRSPRAWLADATRPIRRASPTPWARSTITSTTSNASTRRSTSSPAAEVGVSFGGDTITSLARLELGRDDVRPPSPSIAPRPKTSSALVATESAADRAHNPGLPSRACRHDHRHVLRGAVGDAPVPPRAGHARRPAAARSRRRRDGDSVMRHPSLIRRPPNPRLARPAGDAAAARPRRTSRHGATFGSATRTGCCRGSRCARRAWPTRPATAARSTPAARPATGNARPTTPTRSACSSTTSWPAKSTSTT